MKSERFFKWMWNFNGLVLFLGISVGILFFGYQITKHLLKEDYVPPQTLNLADDKEDEEKWSLGYPNRIGKSDFYYIPLESEKLSVESRGTVVDSFGGSGSYYTETRSKNALFLNSKTNTSNWLFKSVNQLITNISTISGSEYSNNTKAVAMTYEVINSDTNLDGKFNNFDKRTFAISKIDGSDYVEIIEGYSRIVKSVINTEGELFVIFINNNDVFSMLVNLDTFKVVSKKTLPKVGN
ncbi:hypothetical protein GCM10008107_26090 [Psychrosphaera saromensis]|uniref:Uncharacterized protein n=1 Tax=Psychrosphaera saromensis TaxID=716813 RepID=A0A2S7UW19_9GAMM|nr:hypothetical protein [Psychrosphaera saromensis]PQJ54184.1 hypothetical protein BTO11_11335 [Psychrosphaera saromensis]GHB75273.1 hypothetical protein GCM10008107_26090 [Psychrosphaera saromensis]GLQ12721.1 hypothetical protein GCM10007917_01760 [Psychrosphaera saromensis]